MIEIHEPQLTFYRTWNKIFRLRVDINISKLFNGSNIQLPSIADLHDGLALISNNVKHRTGLFYDAFEADTCRIHYAFNQRTEKNETNRVIDFYKNYNVPRMTRTVKEDKTIYFENKSRGIRIYDKNTEIIKKNPRPELIEQSLRLLRYEYYLDGLTNVKRFAKRIGFSGSSAKEMLSESSINLAIKELQTLLGYSNSNYTKQSRIELLFDKTNDLKKSIHLSGFLDALDTFGKEFYRNKIYNNNISKSSYYRDLCECKKLGF